MKNIQRITYLLKIELFLLKFLSCNVASMLILNFTTNNILIKKICVVILRRVKKIWSKEVLKRKDNMEVKAV